MQRQKKAIKEDIRCSVLLLGHRTDKTQQQRQEKLLTVSNGCQPLRRDDKEEDPRQTALTLTANVVKSQRKTTTGNRSQRSSGAVELSSCSSRVSTDAHIPI